MYCYISIGQISRRWRSTSVNWRQDLRRWGNAERLTISAASLWQVLIVIHRNKPLTLVLNVSTNWNSLRWYLKSCGLLRRHTTTFLSAFFTLRMIKPVKIYPIGLFLSRDQIIMETWTRMHLPISMQSTIQNACNFMATSCCTGVEFCMYKHHSYSHFLQKMIKKIF